MCTFSADSTVFIYVCTCMCGDLPYNASIFFILSTYFRYISYEKRADAFGLQLFYLLWCQFVSCSKFSFDLLFISI